MTGTTETERPHEVRIHIDREPHQSPARTTANALYALGGLGPHRELFREVGGNREDELILRDEPEVHVHEDEHFYSEREIILIVNAQPKPWTETKISYEQVTHSGFPDTAPAGNSYHVHGGIRTWAAPQSGRFADERHVRSRQKQDDLRCHRNWSIVVQI